MSTIEAVQIFKKHYSDKSKPEKQKLVQEEFDELRHVPREKHFDSKSQIGSNPKFKEFNRYRDIIPYDKTRVQLNHCDYVNASWVGPDRTYIATQGPKDCTVRHFWEIIIQHKVEVIVMLCNLQECSNTGMMKDKCARYWPADTDQVKSIQGEGKIKNLKLRIVKEEPEKSFIRREISYTHGSSQTRKVYQFQMVNWPDHGVPKNGDHVFELIEKFRQQQSVVQNPKVPILLHCSAGVGRTGTVIAIDRVMQWLNTKTLPRDFSVFNLIKELREARPKMCQTKEQYGFIYDMVEKLFIKHKLLSLKEKKRKANGNTVNSPPTQLDGRGRRGSERRPQSEYNPGGHQIRREERRKSKSLQRLNEAMDLDNFDFKANGIQRVRRHQALRERVMEPSPIQLPDNRLSPPDSFQDNESDLSESELNNGPGMSCNIKTNYQKIDTFENEKHPKEKPKEKGIWPKIKDVFKHNQSPRKGEKQPIIALSISQTSDDAPRNVSSEFVQPGLRSTLPPTRGGGQTSSPPSKTPKTNPVKWRLPRKKS